MHGPHGSAARGALLTSLPPHHHADALLGLLPAGHQQLHLDLEPGSGHAADAVLDALAALAAAPGAHVAVLGEVREAVGRSSLPSGACAAWGMQGLR